MFALLLLSEGGGAGPNTSLSWLLYIVGAFFLLMVVVGWLSSRRKNSQAALPHEAKKSSRKESDDLIKIEGIGPKVVKVLREAGIITFDDLARAKASDVQKVLADAGLQMMNPEGWIDQAKLASKGDFAALEKMQAEMKGGRRK
jgi:hypothetical protein